MDGVTASCALLGIGMVLYESGIISTAWPVVGVMKWKSEVEKSRE